ncbi:MAG: glycosyltransferase [Thauera sp.]|jgi:glycosyltransferase involved in cell wall biosynthesis|nr:glycosyltransferase [Thauera sp.]
MTTVSPTPALISVLIRSTGRDFLDTALASLTTQNWPNIEVLVVNASGQPHPPLPTDFPHPLQLIDSEQPLPRAQAANRLLEAARGRWALFLDDDDWLDAGHLARLAAAMEAEPEVVLAYAGVRCVEKDAAADMQQADGWRTLRVFDDEFDPLRLLIENYIPMHAALFDVERLRPHVRFDPAFDLFEDWDFWLQCLEQGSFAHVAGCSAWYRIHADSGAGVRLERAEQAEAALDQLLTKWRTRWSATQLHQLVGLSRHVRPLQQQLRATEQAAAQERETFATTLAAEQTSHQQALQDLRAELTCYYENSRSWRLTRPLRAAADQARVLRKTLQQRLPHWRRQVYQRSLDTLTSLYRHPQLQWLARRVPASWKRQLRNQLFARLHRPDNRTSLSSTDLENRRELGPQPLVSIIIPVYNHAAYIEQCIRSALTQCWSQLEVIVVDDASPDPAVADILARLATEPRLKLIRHAHNQGISAAQNTALIAARGEIIAFLDCDDYLESDAIRRCMAHWQADTVYAHSGRINEDESGREINRINFVELPRQNYFAENLHAMYATHLKLIRRDVFAQLGLFDPRFDSAQDYEMLMRIAFHYPSASFVHVPDFVYHHRIHAQQASEQQQVRQQTLTQLIQHEARLRMAIRNGEYPRFLSVIMLSYGKHSQTLEAIQALNDSIHIAHEIIVYDNGSAAETVDFIRQHIDGQFAQVRVFYGERNLGPAQGRRAALEHARGEWFLIFDNDELPRAGWLEELLLRAESADDIGAVCCRVAFPDGKLQFSGGSVTTLDDGRIELSLHDQGKAYDELASCVFRELEWSPIGATLFTRNIAPYLHDGYPNVFEDAGVSFALRKQGLRLLNAPGALVWHEHVNYRPDVDMAAQYMKDRYNPALMLKSIASFRAENQLLIHDEYIWRENGLYNLTPAQLDARLEEALQMDSRF